MEEFGVGIINDVSGGDLDSDMFATVAQLNVPYILTHSKGNPQTMQSLTDYKSVTYDVLDFFINKLHQLRQMGVKDIIIDPGFGFAKTIPQNYELLNNLRIFETLNCPILGEYPKNDDFSSIRNYTRFGTQWNYRTKHIIITRRRIHITRSRCKRSDGSH